MLELFRLEVETQCHVLTAGLLALERTPTAADKLEECMRAAHSLKGAARIVGEQAGVKLAHAMEDCFVAAQQGHIVLRHHQIDRLLRGVDLLARVGMAPEVSDEVTGFLVDLKQAIDTPDAPFPALAESVVPAAEPPVAGETVERVLRVTAENLNRLLGLTGESLVESRWLKPFTDSLLRLKRLQHEASAGDQPSHRRVAGGVAKKPSELRTSAFGAPFAIGGVRRPLHQPCESPL
jgi:two-component system sensor histidine kinase and response regulator WspE